MDRLIDVRSYEERVWVSIAVEDDGSLSGIWSRLHVSPHHGSIPIGRSAALRLEDGECTVKLHGDWYVHTIEDDEYQLRRISPHMARRIRKALRLHAAQNKEA